MESKEMRELWTTIHEKDSINTIKVQLILDKYGWLGEDVVGEDGNTTLFLVIQHSHLDVQEKYLPMMRDAVKNGNAEAGDLAYLEDRIAMRHGKNQIYGSQLYTNLKTGKDTLWPIEDYANVDKRRANVGLEPLQDYVSYWGLELNKKSKPINSLKSISNDFATAIEIHDSIVGPVNVKYGCGNHLDIKINNELQEHNSAWFKFTIDKDTMLTFDIVPNQPKDDYDFVLFKCPNKDCLYKIETKSVTPDRWCFSVNYDKYGSTGLSEYVEETHVKLGPGAGYVSALSVKAGETLYLMVDWPYRSTSNGFTIYFYNYWPNKPTEKSFKLKKQTSVVLENVLFETNKTILIKESTPTLDKLVNELNKNKNMKLEIRGYTDNIGEEIANQKLSEARAKTIVDYLVSKKIDAHRLTYKGFGSKQPIATNDTEEGRKKNRRVEFVIVSK
jgi:outer membrane protein OmpA-like peptidoglycan-associated protein